MSADVKDDNQPYDEINVTPMLDLAYVLLVVFIIMTTASVQGIKVEAPQTQTVSSLAKPQTKAITITAAGDVFLDAGRWCSRATPPRTTKRCRPCWKSASGWISPKSGW